MIKKLLILAISLMLLVPFTASASFDDINALDDSLKEPVLHLIADGAISGYEDGTFRPQQDISVGEFAKIVVIPILKQHIIPQLTEFESEDVLKHIIDGDIPEIVDDAEFFDVLEVQLPLSQPITRGEAIDMIGDAYKLSYSSITVFEPLFVDVEDPALQKLSMKLYADSVIQGRDEKHFYPDDHLTRAEASKILYLSQEKYIGSLYYDEYGWEVGGVVLEITDVSPNSLMPGESATIIFNIKDADSGKIIAGIDTGDITVNVIQGNATVDNVTKIGEGVFVAVIKVSDQASAGHINVQISVIYGRLYVETTDDFFDSREENKQSGDLKIFPSVVSRNNTAVIIAIPRDHHDDPVSGLTLTAFVNSGGGKILTDMAEDPVGSGIYTGVYEAGSTIGEAEIGVRIMDYTGDNTYYLSFEVK